VDVLVLLAEVTQAREEAASTNAARMVATLDAEALPRRLPWHGIALSSMSRTQKTRPPCVAISYAAPHAHGIIIIALHREYSSGIVFLFSQGRKGLYHV
jgi:hypothetical protein